MYRTRQTQRNSTPQKYVSQLHYGNFQLHICNMYKQVLTIFELITFYG